MIDLDREAQNVSFHGGESIEKFELFESDLVSIPAGINKSEAPVFEYFKPYKNRLAMNAYFTDRTEIDEKSEENSYGYFVHASHGMSNKK